MNKKEALSYDESDIHPITEIDDHYTLAISEDKDMLDRFILGERMVYSDIGRRSNITLTRENKQNIFSVFQNTKDMFMFFQTLMKDIKYNGNGKCIFNTQVKDMGYLCEADTYLTEDNTFFYSEDQRPDDLLVVFKDIIESRKKVENMASLKPLYIFLFGWDQALKFGVDSNYNLTDQYSVMLQTCGIAHVHFIFLCKGQGDIPRSIIKSCEYSIAGKCDSKSSTSLFESDVAYKTYKSNDGYMFALKGSKLERLKIYQSHITREIREKEIRI